MTTEEFSNEFDVLLNSYITINQDSFKLDEYEKSVLLTESQEAVIKELYSGKLAGEGFEETEERIITTLREELDQRIHQSTTEISNELLSTFYKGFSEQEKQTFLDFLERIEKNFEI